MLVNVSMKIIFPFSRFPKPPPTPKYFVTVPLETPKSILKKMEGKKDGASIQKQLRFKLVSLSAIISYHHHHHHHIVLLVECSPTNQVQEGPSGLLTALDGVTTQKDDDDDEDEDEDEDEEYDDEVEPGPPEIVLKTEDLHE